LRLLPGGAEQTVESGADQATELAAPDEVAERAERVDLLRLAMDDLPTEERQVVELRHLEDWSFERIARQHGLAASTVKDRCYRGMQKLQRRLRELGAGEARDGGTAEVSGA
jgi:RNA polymerase sigma-70 factor (ECF subfamily)